jgi:flagellar basal body rod protein FlgB
MSDSVFSLLAATLNLSQRAEAIVTNNLANLGTPGFQPASLSFQRALASAYLAGTPIAQVSGTLSVQSGAVSADGSGVSMTAQMAQLMRYQLLYSTAAQAWSDEVTQINTAAGGQIP